MKVKTKILLGLVFLFSVIVILSIISIGYLNKLTVVNQKLLKDDYRSLENVHGMQNSLNEIRSSFELLNGSRKGIKKQEPQLELYIISFEEYLKKQKLSIGVVTEENLVNAIAIDFQSLVELIDKIQTKDEYFDELIPLTLGIDQKINRVYLLNRKTIELQNNDAQATAKQVIYTVGVIVSFCILIAFIFLLRFPKFVADPVEKLSSAIEKIKGGDYSTQVDIASQDEFGELGAAFNQMTQQLATYEKMNLSKLLAEKQRIETMIRKLAEGIIGLDSDFNLLFINPFAKSLLNIKDEDLTGISASDLVVNHEISQPILEDLLVYNKGGKRYTRNKLIKGRIKDKPAYFIRKVILTYSQSEGKQVLDGYILMLKNITEFKELDEARTNFIATVSHELKTPIAAIKLSLKLLRDKRLSELTKDQEELVETVESEINRLLNISQELLNANELESGQIHLHPESISAEEIVGEAIDSVLTLADDRKIAIEENLAPNIPLLFLDEDKTVWILINFLTNAIKYSPVKSVVKIDVFLEEDDLIFSVTDQGRGIAKSEQEKIFERYYRIQGSDGKGTGLGLSISKEIVTQMGGNISVSSEVGEGSTFKIRLRSPFAEKNG